MRDNGFGKVGRVQRWIKVFGMHPLRAWTRIDNDLPNIASNLKDNFWHAGNSDATLMKFLQKIVEMPH